MFRNFQYFPCYRLPQFFPLSLSPCLVLVSTPRCLRRLCCSLVLVACWCYLCKLVCHTECAGLCQTIAHCAVPHCHARTRAVTWGAWCWCRWGWKATSPTIRSDGRRCRLWLGLVGALFGRVCSAVVRVSLGKTLPETNQDQWLIEKLPTFDHINQVWSIYEQGVSVVRTTYERGLKRV